MENMELPHIKISQATDGMVSVEVEDTELFDFVENYLIEDCDIEYDYQKTSERNCLSIYTMFFSKKYTKEIIESALNKLDANEIESVFKINNK